MKLLNLIPIYLNTSICEIIDNEIKKITDENLIKISNIRLEDIKSELIKTKYKSIHYKKNYTIYEYETHFDIFIDQLIINLDDIIKDIINEENIQNCELLEIKSKSLKKNILLDFINENNENKIEKIKEKIKKIKKISSIKLKFYKEKKNAPSII